MAAWNEPQLNVFYDRFRDFADGENTAEEIECEQMLQRWLANSMRAPDVRDGDHFEEIARGWRRGWWASKQGRSDFERRSLFGDERTAYMAARFLAHTGR